MDCWVQRIWGKKRIVEYKYNRYEDKMKKDGAGNRNWTRDPLITNQVLYQLSYTGNW